VGVKWTRGGVVAAILTAAALAPAQASAATTSVFGGKTVSGNAIPCTTQSDGVRVCYGADNNGPAGSDLRLKSFDGQPLEVYVILPPAPSAGNGGPYPLVVQSHGWGSSARGPENGSFRSSEYYGPTADVLAKAGYAVLQLTARGFGDSCGKATSAIGLFACGSHGYIRLDDDRYEVRDIQRAIGLLVDEKFANHSRIGATGESYGGGVSLQLATLKNRVMWQDGSLHPWRSPGGTPLSLTAAAPVIPWSDLIYSLTPNGRTLDYRVTGPNDDLSPLGVEKESFVSGLYFLGTTTGSYALPGQDPQADLTTWYAAIQQGDPPNPTDPYIIDQIARYHSAYYLLDGKYGAAAQSPPPLLIANGFTDDLFPVDEAVRYYNLERSLYPADPLSLLDGDFGHERAANKPGDEALLSNAIQTVFNYWLQGVGTRPRPRSIIEPASAETPGCCKVRSGVWRGGHVCAGGAKRSRLQRRWSGRTLPVSDKGSRRSARRASNCSPIAVAIALSALRCPSVSTRGAVSRTQSVPSAKPSGVRSGTPA